MLRKSWIVLTLLAVSAVGGGAEYKTILGGKGRNIQEGFIYGNLYCQIAFLNPSKHVGTLSAGDINIMPRHDVNGKPTLEEKESKLRIFCKPSLRVTTVARRIRTVSGDGDWSLEKIPGGVKYTRSHADSRNSIDVEYSVVFDKKNAQIRFDLKMENSGNGECRVDFSPDMTFLRDDVKPMSVILRRSAVRYYDGKRSEIFYNEKTLLDGSYRNYWWRRVNPGNKEFLNHFNRERIPFNHARLQSPSVFGVIGLAGEATLVWDMGKSKLNNLEIFWDGILGGVSPGWNLVLKPGEKFQQTFRMLTLRGLDEVDAVQDDWVFGYLLDKDMLYIKVVPLSPRQRLAIQGVLNDSNNSQVLINQRAEMAAMNPFLPGRMEWRAAQPFRQGVTYPIKVTMTKINDGSFVLVESSGTVMAQ